MALPFVLCQCSSPPVDECLWDALAPAVSVHSVETSLHSCNTSSPLQQAVESVRRLILNFTWYSKVQNLLMERGQPCLYWLSHISWDGISTLQNEGVYWWMESMFAFFLFEQYTPVNTVCVGMFLNAAIPLDWMDRSTQALSTLAVHKDFNQSVCLSVSPSQQYLTSFFQFSTFVKGETTQKSHDTVLKVLLCDDLSSFECPFMLRYLQYSHNGV